MGWLNCWIKPSSRKRTIFARGQIEQIEQIEQIACSHFFSIQTANALNSGPLSTVTTDIDTIDNAMIDTIDTIDICVFYPSGNGKMKVEICYGLIY